MSLFFNSGITGGSWKTWTSESEASSPMSSTPANDMELKGIFSDSNIFLWHESEDNKKAYFQNFS